MNISPIAITAETQNIASLRLGTSMIRQAADQQNAMAQMLATNVKNAPTAGNGHGTTFSTYA